MKVTQEKLPAGQIGLKIEITPEMSKQAYEKTLQEFTRSANIPGFRKGKVPRQVLIQRFGSARLKATVVEELIESSLKKAVEQEKIEAIGSFELRSSFDQLVSQFEPGLPFTFAAAVDVPPEINLARYSGFQVQAEDVTYDPAKVDEVLEGYRHRAATLIPVEERPAQQGDVAVVDFTGRLVSNSEGAEPEEIPGGSAADFEIELSKGKFIEGFVDGIIGMNLGETKDVEATFPAEYPQENLAGKPAAFTVTLKELKEKELPELDDDFAQEISDFETLVELRESLDSRFQKEVEDQIQANKEQSLLNELVQHLEVDLPETLVKQQVDYMLNQTAMRLSNQGIDIKQLFTPELVQQFRDRSRPDAIAELQRTLALSEVAKRESIQVTTSEIKPKVDEFLKNYSGQDVDPERVRQMVEENLLKEKIFNWLEQNSTVELVPEGSLAPSPSTREEAEDTVNVPAISAVDAIEPASESTIDVAAEVVPTEIAGDEIQGVAPLDNPEPNNDFESEQDSLKPSESDKDA